MTNVGPACEGAGLALRPEAVVWWIGRSLRGGAREKKDRQLTIRVHPDVALYLLEQEEGFLKEMQKKTGVDLELRDDPIVRLDEFKLWPSRWGATSPRNTP